MVNDFRVWLKWYNLKTKNLINKLKKINKYINLGGGVI